MKDKKYKYLEDLFDEYLDFLDEQTEINSQHEKWQKKFAQHRSPEPNATYDVTDANNLYKAFVNLQKYEVKLTDHKEQIGEIEEVLRSFLLALEGGKISYESKDDNGKSKCTFIFSLEGDKIKCEKQ